MNSRIYILFAAWIAVGVAFYFAHPIAYSVILIGSAASISIAAEDLRDAYTGEQSREAVASRGQPRDAPVKVAVTRVSLRESLVPPSSRPSGRVSIETSESAI